MKKQLIKKYIMLMERYILLATDLISDIEKMILSINELTEPAQDISDINSDINKDEKITEEEYVERLGNMLVTLDNRGYQSEAGYPENIAVSLNILAEFLIEKELYRIKNAKED